MYSDEFPELQRAPGRVASIQRSPLTSLAGLPVMTPRIPSVPPPQVVTTQSQAETLVPVEASQRSQLEKNIDNSESTITHAEEEPTQQMEVEQPIPNSGSTTHAVDEEVDVDNRDDQVRVLEVSVDESQMTVDEHNMITEARIESVHEDEEGEDEVSGAADSDRDKKTKRRSERIADQSQNTGDAGTGASESEGDRLPAGKGKGKRLGRNRPKARAPILKAPDLPLPDITPSSDNNLKDLESVEPAVFNRQSVHGKLHCANRNHPPVPFDFHVSVTTVSGTAIIAYQCMALTTYV
jgi:hypothetical protein